MFIKSSIERVSKIQKTSRSKGLPFPYKNRYWNTDSSLDQQLKFSKGDVGVPRGVSWWIEVGSYECFWNLIPTK